MPGFGTQTVGPQAEGSSFHNHLDPLDEPGRDKPALPTPPRVDRPRLTGLQDLPGPGGPADADADLRRVVDAYLTYRRSVLGWLSTTEEPQEQIRDYRHAIGAEIGAQPGPSVDRRAHGGTLPAALSQVLVARTDLVSAALTLEGPAIHGDRGTRCSVRTPPAYAFDLCGADSTYEHNYSLIVDLGGNDTYLNNAGGTRLTDICEQSPTPAPVGFAAAALVDVAGDDAYGDPEAPSSCGVNGGAVMGAGFLLDRAGDDMYAADSYGVNGGAWIAGLGYLRDLAGDDRYLAGVSTVTVDPGDGNVSHGNRGVNGGGNGAVGTLVDDAGDDVYRAGVESARIRADGIRLEAGSNAVNGGGLAGVGHLADRAGSDRYLAGIGTLRLTGDGAYVLAAWRSIHGGGATAGVGYLADGGGPDTYRAGIRNASVSTDGSDLVAAVAGITGGAHGDGAEGTLIERGGSDRYRVGADRLTGRGHDLALQIAIDGIGGGASSGPSGADGLLWDWTGSDDHRAGVGWWNLTGTDVRSWIVRDGLHGGAHGTSDGTLLDEAGDDRYVNDVVAQAPGSVDPVFLLTYAVNGGTYPVGFEDPSSAKLIDRGGHDWYQDHAGGTGWDRTVAPKGAAGAQADRAG